MRMHKQLSVFVENRPGALAKLCGTLAEAGINILALSVNDTVDHAVVRLIVDNNIKALMLIEQQGLYLNEQDVVVVEVGNRPGVLAEIARLLARADINIDYAYCAAMEHQNEGCLVLKTDNPERTMDVLKKGQGFE